MLSLCSAHSKWCLRQDIHENADRRMDRRVSAHFFLPTCHPSCHLVCAVSDLDCVALNSIKFASPDSAGCSLATQVVLAPAPCRERQHALLRCTVLGSLCRMISCPVAVHCVGQHMPHDIKPDQPPLLPLLAR
eukprot:351270-Chlamydomonas_euryale.AAC.11